MWHKVRINIIIALMLPAGPWALAAADDFSSVQDKIQACFACHGENGASTSSEYPILAGQEEYYIYLQLKDFKSGLRKNDVMRPFVANLEKDEMKLIARYFSQQDWPMIGHKPLDKNVDAAGVAIDSGQCVACHLGDFKGNSRVPRLAGQFPGYLQKTMLDFKTKTRANAPDKSSLFKAMSNEDIKSLADYLGSLVVHNKATGAEIH